MKYRRLGRLGISVSEVGLGTSQLSNTDGACVGTKYVAPAVARQVLSVAVENGVNVFDAADQYGGAESLLGELQPSIKSRTLIATKAGLRRDGIRDFTEAYLSRQVDRSLKRLNAESIDLFQLNKPGPSDLDDGHLFVFLNTLKRLGKIKYAGVVVGDLEAGARCVNSESVDCVQVLYNLLYSSTEDLIRAAWLKGIGVIVRSPLNSGVLSGAYTEQTVFPPTDERFKYFSGAGFVERMRALKRIQSDLKVANADLLEFAMRYVLSNPHVSVVVPGASSVDQATRYIACSERDRFSIEELVRIKEVVAYHLKDTSQNFQS